MYSAEVLSQLRTLNWLLGEVRRLPADNPQRSILESQIESVRARLPLSILRYHDARAKQKLPSVSNLNGANCSNCHLKLPAGTVAELAKPGRFGVCPNCGVFVWSGDVAGAENADATGSDERPQKKPKASRV